MNSHHLIRVTPAAARTTLSAVVLLLAVGITVGVAGCAPATVSAGNGSSSVPSSPTATSAAPRSSGTGSKDIDACTLLPTATASTLVGETLTAGVSSTIAAGQDQCMYGSTGPDVGLTVIIYETTSGVTWSALLAASGASQPVSGVGDKAETNGVLELDVQAGTRLIAVQDGNSDARVAVAKALVGALK